MNGSVRENGADAQRVQVSDEDTATTAAEIRSLADEAEAEFAEAQALAVAARARVRAIRMRRQASLVEAKDGAHEAVSVVDATAGQSTQKNDTAGDDADEAGSAQIEVHDTRDIPPDDTASGVEPESVQSDESPDDALGEPEADCLSDGASAPNVLRLRRPKGSTITVALAVVVTLAALSGSGYMLWEHRQAERHRLRMTEFAAAARQGVVTLTSLDFHNAKQGLQAIVDNSTGAFKDEFVKMADDFTKVVEQSKVVEQGSVQATAVDLDTMTNDSAVVLVASTSEVTNAAGAKQEPRKYRLIVTVTRSDGQLKMSKVEFVP